MNFYDLFTFLKLKFFNQNNEYKNNFSSEFEFENCYI